MDPLKSEIEEVAVLQYLSLAHRKTEAMKGAKEADQSVETKIMELAKVNINLCKAICAYKEPIICAKRPFECNLNDDLQIVFEQMKLADGILITSPVIL